MAAYSLDRLPGAGELAEQLDATGTLHITAAAVACALNLRSHNSVLIDAGFADLEVPIPWWDGAGLAHREEQFGIDAAACRRASLSAAVVVHHSPR